MSDTLDPDVVWFGTRGMTGYLDRDEALRAARRAE
jgi:hypothetical protein